MRGEQVRGILVEVGGRRKKSQGVKCLSPVNKLVSCRLRNLNRIKSIFLYTIIASQVRHTAYQDHNVRKITCTMSCVQCSFLLSLCFHSCSDSHTLIAYICLHHSFCLPTSPFPFCPPVEEKVTVSVPLKTSWTIYSTHQWYSAQSMPVGGNFMLQSSLMIMYTFQ